MLISLLVWYSKEFFFSCTQKGKLKAMNEEMWKEKFEILSRSFAFCFTSKAHIYHKFSLKPFFLFASPKRTFHPLFSTPSPLIIFSHFLSATTNIYVWNYREWTRRATLEIYFNNCSLFNYAHTIHIWLETFSSHYRTVIRKYM